MKPIPPSAYPTPHDTFLAEVLEGLQKPAKTLPCKYFYDERGSRLFEEICELDEYYLTRTELRVLEDHVQEMAALLGLQCLLIELGSGSGRKTCILLDHLNRPAGYVPIDLSRESLMHSAQAIRDRFPRLLVRPLCADFTVPISLPHMDVKESRRVAFFPGSTIGNFGPIEATNLFRHIAHLCGPGGGLLIGADLKKDLNVLLPAYNDSRGVTAAFNLNLLVRINRELGADFQIDQFRHEALYDQGHGRIEMYLISEQDQTVHIGPTHIAFHHGERICTEYSYKYGIGELPSLAAPARFQLQKAWTDERQWFSVQYFSLP